MIVKTLTLIKLSKLLHHRVTQMLFYLIGQLIIVLLEAGMLAATPPPPPPFIHSGWLKEPQNYSRKLFLCLPQK